MQVQWKSFCTFTYSTELKHWTRGKCQYFGKYWYWHAKNAGADFWGVMPNPIDNIVILWKRNIKHTIYWRIMFVTISCKCLIQVDKTLRKIVLSMHSWLLTSYMVITYTLLKQHTVCRLLHYIRIWTCWG